MRQREKVLKAGRYAALAAMLCSQGMPAQQAATGLESGFQTPPETARPRVWWHWMNGNITKEGINADLDWMHRVGIGGFQNFDAALGTPQVVEKRLVYMTPEWKEAFLFATKKADSLGLEMAIAGSPGWSESGGPWVPPSHAMKKVVWGVTQLEGGKPFHGVLNAPPQETGPFGNLAQQDLMGAMGGSNGVPKVSNFGKDTVVVAYREPAADVPVADLHPTVTTNAGPVADPSVLWDNDLNHSLDFLAAEPGENSWVQYDFGKPQTIQSAVLALGGPANPLAMFIGETNQGPMLQKSDDGVNFTDVVRFPTAGSVQHTMSFAPVTARYLRVVFHELARMSMSQGDIDLTDFGGMPAPKGPAMRHIAEFAVYVTPRVNRFEEKAAFAALPDNYGFATPPVASDAAIPTTDVVDLTGKMQADGTLDWTPPPGRWTVLRMGYSLTGITNHPATPEATGPEVDKLDAADVKDYFTQYLDKYKDATGGMMGKRGLRYVINDSWEAGTQNWTDSMIPEFKKRRGYDPLPWMPVLAGHVVGSAAQSDQFLWDYRRTIAELLAENHYGVLNAELHARGMGQYGESHEEGRATIGDGMEMKRYDDVPMAAMWTQRPGVNREQFGYDADIRESASVAHIWGQNLVAAESMTASSNPWGWCPNTLKPTADKELAVGLNRFVIHTSVHQPLMGKAPGLALGPFGQWFNRNETWAEQAKPWISYLARNSYLLQQGRFVADIAYFYGEDSNVTAIFARSLPEVPTGYNYDFVNFDALAHKLSVKEGALVTESGMRYRVLVLDPYSTHMSLPVLRRVQQLVEAGATVIGKRPADTPSLADDQAEFAKIADAVWGSDGQDRSVGKGRVLQQGTVAEALAKAEVQPDFSFAKPRPESEVLFVHRHTPTADLYYIDNRSDKPESIDASFRVTGKAAELWHADTGKIEPASYRMADGRTTVPLQLDAWGTVFVVFRAPAKSTSRTLPAMQQTKVADVDGAWEVKFEAGRGAPATATLDRLASFSENSDPGIKYFSGHATYTKHINVPASAIKAGSKLWIDLGDVANLAEVTVNGKPLGIAWKAPYRIEATGALHVGDNTLEVRVVDLWVNRLIGDAQPNAKQYTFTVRDPYKANSRLVPAGLIGPVQLVREERVSEGKAGE
ncbi:MAG: glycoside hydrolase [Acidobacteriota bacterium]|nr:glycoside hydrolase [Acidobacteriota bacterium]